VKENTKVQIAKVKSQIPKIGSSLCGFFAFFAPLRRFLTSPLRSKSQFPNPESKFLMGSSGIEKHPVQSSGINISSLDH
jgi:hypothetical protein